MRALRSWGTVVLLLEFMMVVAVPKDAMAEKSLGVTKKAYIKAYNEQLSRLYGVRLEKRDESSTATRATYSLLNDKVEVVLDLYGPSDKLTNVSIILFKRGSSQDELLEIMNLGIAYAVELNPTITTINQFTKKMQDKFDQGLKKFSFEMGDKLITMVWDKYCLVNIAPL